MHQIDCAYCEKPIAKGPRIIINDGDGISNGRRIGSMHKRCYEYWMGLMADVRQAAAAKRAAQRRTQGPQHALGFIRRHEVAS